ncbi:penicillin-binding protein 2 [Luminiphilus syltensis NOR5-1B]|uniref:Peptidoglycan D,D-transpeptidase MrdA n=1 Tax=Luminiphilus syltensis NOR5-1B TaxID=565045 RepID=B8KSM1_9GAMM|nr:penicillin-binding protein 2 [Luminiphilus syltensis]EED35376.1 penicillin-binding protein 2 [Luminiphilus syltensis NOR5-1B]
MLGERDSLRDTGRESSINTGRVLLAGLLVTALMVGLVARYYSLQITNYEQFLTESDRNRVRLEPIPPTRGLIMDRKGRLLATNKPSHRLSIVIERADDIDRLLDRLGELIVIELEDLARFESRRHRRRPYEPVPLKLQLTDTEQAIIAVNRHDLPGVTIEAQLTRYYPHGDLLSHVVGYVGRINEREAARIDAANYSGTLHIGKVGLERRYEAILHGQVGYQNVEANAHGRVLRVLDKQPPKDGAILRLHLDLDLQRAAYDALGEQRGAVVAMDPRTGGVLALVSNPGFDSNLFVNGISSRDYAALRDSPDTPLLNRAVQGQYPPGSTVKPMLGLAGLKLGLVTPESTVPDPGWYRIPGDSRRYRDWILRIRGTGHAPEVDLKMAIAESCDVYYYDLARRMGIDRLAQSLKPYGFGEKTGIDITSEKAGILPNREWKRGYLGQPWYPGETLSAGIGQGYMLATPVQLAQATMVLANRGTSRVPSLVRRIDNQPVGFLLRKPLTASEKDWSAVIAGMMDVVHSRRGTARAIGKGASYTIAGKTGTSQVIGIAQDAVYDEDAIAERHRNHGLFVAFAPVDDPEIVVAVLAENGGGSSAAYPVARKVMDAWFGGIADG